MEMEYALAPTVLFFPPPFPPPSPKAIDVSSLEFILVLLAVIPIAAIIYAFFFTIKCPRRSSGSSFSHGSGPRGGTGEDDAVSGLEFTKDATADAHMGDECPVCLSTFAEGEEIRQLSACKHAFHTACIDPWLSSHSNCPICRAVVGVKTPSSTSSSAAWGGEGDAEHHQGLPDASFLV